VRQGDPLSSLIFNSMLENVFKELQWEKKVVNINGTYLSNLRFADDVILISEEEEEIKEIIQELNEKGKEKGLTISVDKTLKY